jgi:hypothetical protein
MLGDGFGGQSRPRPTFGAISDNAQTPPKPGHQHGPEDEAGHEHHMVAGARVWVAGSNSRRHLLRDRDRSGKGRVADGRGRCDHALVVVSRNEPARAMGRRASAVAADRAGATSRGSKVIAWLAVLLLTGMILWLASIVFGERITSRLSMSHISAVGCAVDSGSAERSTTSCERRRVAAGVERPMLHGVAFHVSRAAHSA